MISPKAVIQGGILRFPAAEPSDESQYLCRVRNSAGQHMARAFLQVQSTLCSWLSACPPLKGEGPTDQASLTTSPSASYPGPLSLPTRDSTDLPPLEGLRDRRQVELLLLLLLPPPRGSKASPAVHPSPPYHRATQQLCGALPLGPH